MMAESKSEKDRSREDSDAIRPQNRQRPSKPTSVLGDSQLRSNQTMVLGDAQPKSTQTIILGSSDLSTLAVNRSEEKPTRCPTLVLDNSIGQSQDQTAAAKSKTAEQAPPADQKLDMRFVGEAAKNDRPAGLCSDAVDQHDHPTDAEPNAALPQAITAAQAGNLPLARWRLEAAVKSDPDNPICWLWVAWAADSPAAAISALEQAELHAPNNAVIQLGLAWAKAMGEFDLSSSISTEDDSTTPESSGNSIPPHPASPVEEQLAELSDAERSAVDTTPRDSSEGEINHIVKPAEVGPAHPDGDDAGTRVAENATADIAFSNELVDEQVVDEIDVISSEMNHFLESGELSASPKLDTVEHARREDLVQPTKPTALEDQAAEVHDVDANTSVVHDANDSDDHDASSSKVTILAVDDSPTIRKLVSITLQRAGYNVVTATDGMDAVEVMKTVQPALILMDINMPTLDGYQLCKLVKNHEKTRHIRVIMLSGKDGMFNKLRGKRSGCDDYISKPFETSKLLAKVAAHLSSTPSHP